MSATAPDEPRPRKSAKKRQPAGGPAPLPPAPLPPTGKGPRPSAARVRFGRVMMKVVSSVAAGFFSALILTIIINLMFFGVGAGAGTATTFFLFAVLFVILTFGYVYLLISADEMDQMLEEQYEGLRSIFQLLFGKSTANKSKTETETKNPDQETAWDKRVRELLAEDSELEKAAQETKTAAEKPEVADKTAKTDATGTKTVSATGRERISATGTQHKEGAGEGPASGLVAANANPAETEAVGSGEGTPEGDDVADGPVPLSVEAEPVAKMVGQLNPIETTRLNELCKDVMQFFQPSVDFALENSPHAEEGKFNNFNNFGCHLYLAGACEAYARSKAIPGDLWYAAIQMASQSFSGSETQAALFARRYEEYLLDEKNQEILKFGRDAMVRWLDGDREEIGRSLVWALESWNQKRDHIKKPVAVLFTDIAGSTEYTQRFGDEASHRMLTLHNAIVRESLRFHNGREVKHTGDGIMASFDNPLMSARAAIAIQRGIAAFNASQPSQAIQLKIGINAGRPIEEDGDFFGSTVQLAARITDSAEPGTILVSDYF
ncbi:MAG: adenylate/guanylate cyclase domain-containing protein, partial [Pseudomonadota bacterium]